MKSARWPITSAGAVMALRCSTVGAIGPTNRPWRTAVDSSGRSAIGALRPSITQLEVRGRRLGSSPSKLTKRAA